MRKWNDDNDNVTGLYFELVALKGWYVYGVL